VAAVSFYSENKRVAPEFVATPHAQVVVFSKTKATSEKWLGWISAKSGRCGGLIENENQML